MTVELWNRVADGVLRWMLERGLVSACVLAVALAAYFVLRARLRVTAPLFAASLLVLVLPVERVLPAALALAPVARPVDVLAEAVGPLPEVPEETPAGTAPAGAGPEAAAAAPGMGAAAPPARAAAPTPGAWLLLGWALVAAALLARLLRNQLRARRLVRDAAPLGGPVADDCARLAREIGLRRVVRCVESAGLESPATWGVRRPVLALPRGLAERLSAAERRWILLHELHHVRRHDVLQQLVQHLLQIAWWFDPLVWLAGRMVDRQRECLCDDDALRRLADDERTGGARAFVKVLERAAAAPAGLAGLWNEKRFVKRRLVRLLEDPTGPARGPAALALALVAAVALPAARALVGTPAAPVEAGEPDESDDTSATSTALARAVDWLLARQVADGRFLAGPDPSHGGANDVGVTALAALALVDARTSARAAEVDAAVDRAVDYLLEAQDEESGRLGVEAAKLMYNHGYATLALARIRAARPEIVPLARLQDAVAYVERTRSASGGWRYGSTYHGPTNSSITGLMLHALAAARDAGAEVDRASLEAGLRYLGRMTDPATGETRYDVDRRWSARPSSASDPAPAPIETETMTAVALSARLRVGVDREQARDLATSFARLAHRPPAWSEGGVDFYYWWYGTSVMQRLGGDEWSRWKERLAGALLGRQETGGDLAGSWPDADVWSGLGGRVYATALNVLSLQAAAR